MMKRLAFILMIATTNPIAGNSSSHLNDIPPDKVILITVNEDGAIYMGVDTIYAELLTTVLRQRLFKSYIGTGKMPDAIRLEFSIGVPQTIKENIRTAIKEAQDGALLELCLQLHKKRYEDLSDSQQKKIKKKFPVLFQPAE